MRNLLLVIFLFATPLAYGQITFTTIPLDSALVARSPINNQGTYNVEGFVDSVHTPYDSICLKVYRDSVLLYSFYETMFYTGDSAAFNFTFQIPAELHEYMLQVYGVASGISTLDTSIDGLLAGDVYVIDGQSNALAEMRDNGTSDSNKSEFIRVFGNSDSATSGLMANLRWFRGEGDGAFTENGHAGQWGLRLGRLLSDSTQIPIAIFNNGCGGTPISYYERLSNYKTNPNSNYGRLYFRLNYTGLKDNVKGIIWSQGETDALNATSTATYIKEFDTLRKCFYQDFPGFKKLYIFQTRNGCAANITDLMSVKEAQRQEAVLFDTSTEIMSTSALRQDTGDCHFDYHGGYEIFGDRIYHLIARDIYSIASTREIDAPMVQNAYMSDTSTLVVVESADSLIQHDFGTPIQDYEIENANSATIDSIYLNKNNIIFRLSKFPGPSMTVSYLAQYKDSANWLTNTNDIEVLCFYKYPVSDSLLANTTTLSNSVATYMKVYPNPFLNYTHVEVNSGGIHFLEVDDVTGRQLKQIEFTGKQYILSAEGLAKGMYFIRVTDKNNNVIGTSKIVVQ